MTGIGIVGAGIGGLTLALACRQAGLDEITVYEQADAPQGLGAGVQLSPNASRVLVALGLREALTGVAFFPRAVHLRTWRTGYLVAMRPLGAFSESRYGAPYLHLHRADLHQVLLDAAAARGVRIVSGRRCDGAGQDGAGAWVELGGERQRHAVVIGCDGIHSVVRSSLFDDAAPRYSGHVAWRGMVPTDRLPPRLIPDTATVWMGPGRHFVHYYVRRGELVNFVGVVASPRRSEESWRHVGDPAQLADDFAGWHPMVRTLIEAADDAWLWDLYDHAPMPAWTRGAITLLGDACHPMLPYLAQGAAMAIEDAWVLAVMLERWEDDPARALPEYERYRRPRTARVQARSAEQGELFHLPDGAGALRRNLKLALGSRYLPEIAMRQFDWLHGFDCIRGFES
ncbi:MAG: FAD-dependent monooxygenase [Pseudomonadales bacterium]